MITFERAIDIAAPPARVWEVMSDGERWHEWTPSVARVTIYGKPLAVGSRALIRQPKFPPAWWKVTELVPGEQFTWISTAPGLRVIARHGVEARPGGTRATLRLSLDGWFGGWMARLTGAITERYLTYEAEGLKARSEDPAYHLRR
jgi:hypothetical protein